MKLLQKIFLMLLMLTAIALSQTAADTAAVLQTLDSWNRGWAEKDVDLAIEAYSDDCDWTNAFGDRFQGKAALKKGLAFIFSLDFVMAGNSGGNEFRDVTFLASDIALIRSKLVRVGQLKSSGEKMPDRHINHLRVLNLRDGKWQIVSHMISQAQPKR